MSSSTERNLAHLIWQPPKGDEHIADAGLRVRDLSDETVDDKGQHAADDCTRLRAHRNGGQQLKRQIRCLQTILECRNRNMTLAPGSESSG